MCQAEVAHHANRCPEYSISRDVRNVHLYTAALGINKVVKAKQKDKGPCDEGGSQEALATMPSDVDLYEHRTSYRFATDTPPSPHLPQQTTPEEQVLAASLWDFFRLVRFKGGQHPCLQWHDAAAWPIVVMSPVVKLIEGPTLPWALAGR